MFFSKLAVENLIKGKEIKYPYKLRLVKFTNNVPEYYHVEIENQNELLDHIQNWIGLEQNEGKDLKTALEDIGFSDTINLVDNKTYALFHKYSYYSSPATPPAPYNNELWEFCVTSWRGLFNG